MSTFDDTLDLYVGSATDRADIRAMVRRCWHYALDGLDIRMWQGRGRLHTIDAVGAEHEWLGTIDADGNDVHQTPMLSDGRDGSSLDCAFTLGYLDQATYDGIKADQGIVFGRPVTCYLALFEVGEGLRPQTPIVFFKEMTIFAPLFDEPLELVGNSLVRRYTVTVLAKDGNHGRSEVPGRTYTDTMQREYARSLGVALDRGCEFVAGLAARTYRVR